MDVDPVEETNLDVDTVMSDGHKETTNDVAMDMTERETIDHDMATDIQVPAEADDHNVVAHDPSEPLNNGPIESTSTDWPPAPTSVPPVPSQLARATAIPQELEHAEGKLSRSEVNSVVAEPPASPALTVASTAQHSEAAQIFTVEQASSLPSAHDQKADVIDTEAEPLVQPTEHDSVQEEAVGDDFETVKSPAEPSKTLVETDTIEESKSHPSPRIQDVSDSVNATTTLQSHVESRETLPLLVKEHAKADEIKANGQDDAQHNDTEEANDGEDHPEQPTFILVERVDGVYQPLFTPIPLDLQDALRLELDSRSTEVSVDEDAQTEVVTDFASPLISEDVAEDLLKAPLSDLFTTLRAALGSDWDENRGSEMFLSEKKLRLRIGEDNRLASTLELHQFARVFAQCCPQAALVLSIEKEPVRFSARYKAIQDALRNLKESDDEQDEDEDYDEEEEQVDDDETEELMEDTGKDDVDPLVTETQQVGDVDSSMAENQQVADVDSSVAKNQQVADESEPKENVKEISQSVVDTVDKISSSTQIEAANEEQVSQVATTTTAPLDNQTSRSIDEEDGQDQLETHPEGDDDDEYGINAAIKHSEQEADQASTDQVTDAVVESATAVVEPADAVESDQSNPTLKRSLEEPSLTDGDERPVKRRSSPSA